MPISAGSSPKPAINLPRRRWPRRSAAWRRLSPVGRGAETSCARERFNAWRQAWASRHIPQALGGIGLRGPEGRPFGGKGLPSPDRRGRMPMVQARRFGWRPGLMDNASGRGAAWFSVLDWGSRGRGFKSLRPEWKRPEGTRTYVPSGLSRCGRQWKHGEEKPPCKWGEVGETGRVVLASSMTAPTGAAGWARGQHLQGRPSARATPERQTARPS